MLRRAALRLAAGRACAATVQSADAGVRSFAGFVALAGNASTPSQRASLSFRLGRGFGVTGSPFHSWAPLKGADDDASATSSPSPIAGNTSEADLAIAGVVFQTQRVLALRKALHAMSEVTPTIDAKHLEELCSSKGFSVQRENIVEALQKAGVVLRVNGKVFLHPDRVVRTALLKIDDQCDIAAGRPTARERLQAMDLIKSEIDMRAERRTKVVLTGILGFLFAQLAVFVRLTYWELSWDTMEPAGFFYISTLSTMGQIYFITQREEFSNEGLRGRISGWFRRRLYRKAGFSLDEYEALRQRIEEAQ